MKLISMLSAAALAIALGGAAFAQDKTNDPGQPGTQQQQQNQPTEQDSATQKERDYQAELKKCDNTSDKQKCVEAAKKKFGQM